MAVLFSILLVGFVASTSATGIFLPDCESCCQVPLIDLVSANAGLASDVQCVMNKDTITPAQSEMCVTWFSSGCPLFCEDGSRPACADKSTPACADKSVTTPCTDGKEPVCKDKKQPACPASMFGTPAPLATSLLEVVSAPIPAGSESSPVLPVPVPAAPKCQQTFSDAACSSHCRQSVGMCVSAALVPDLNALFSKPAAAPAAAGAAPAGASGPAAPAAAFREIETSVRQVQMKNAPSNRPSFRPAGQRAMVGGRRVRE